MHTILTCMTQDDMVELGRRLGSTFREGTVVSLRGSLGAGKTVFARGVARSLGIDEAIVSPTFTLVQEYDGRLPLYHMDLYRIETVEDFEMIGGEDMLYSNGVCLVEWSEVIDELLPKDTVFISIAVNPNQSRTVEIDAPQGDGEMQKALEGLEGSMGRSCERPLEGFPLNGSTKSDQETEE